MVHFYSIKFLSLANEADLPDNFFIYKSDTIMAKANAEQNNFACF